MNEPNRSSEPPDEPHYKSQPTILSPASPKPLQFPQPTNIPVLENMMDVGFNQTELHMNDPAMRNTELRPDAWRDPSDQQQPSSGEHDNASPFSTGGDLLGTLKTADAAIANTGPTDSVTSGDESAVNGNAVRAIPFTNGNSYNTNHQLPTDIPSQDGADASFHPSHPSVPTAAYEHSPTTAETVQAQFNEVTLDQSQQASIPGEVDVQALLNTLQTSIAPTTQVTVPPRAEESYSAAALSPSHPQPQPSIPGVDIASPLSAAGLGAPPSGLPPRPPPQDQPLINPNYVHTQHIRDYHPHAANPAVPNHVRSNSSGNADPNAASYTQPIQTSSMQQSTLPGGPVHQSGPAASPTAHTQPANPALYGQQQQQQQQQRQFTTSTTPIESRREYKIAAGETPNLEDQPWTQDIQRKYDHFMEEERRYVNEARWDQFPQGSRLFVGNLSSEKVTKRDIFHVFHTYGELAQISIKQAYGFVQFLRTEDCSRALAAEQGRQIRDKRIHLEISKPQKSSKNQQQNQSRRSRSPEYGNRGRAGSNVDRYVSGGRNGGRGRDGGRDSYRSGYRSPSPRDYRDRYGDRYRTRSRSPGYGRGYRGVSPRRESEDDLPLPRRQPHDVPDVQIIALDQLDRDFLSWVEKAFTARGVRVDVLILSPRLSEEAVVRRQIMEGVLAVTKLKRANQSSSLIGLTIFKRKQGSRDVNFEEYDNLDPNICVELVLREKQAQGTAYGNYQYGAAPQPPQPSQHQYGMPPQQAPAFVPPASYPPGYGQPPARYGMPPPGGPQPGPGSPHLNVDPNNLQNLLSTLNQASPQTPQTAASFGNPTGYAAQSYPPQQDPYAAYRNNPAYANMIPGQQSQPQPQPQPQTPHSSAGPQASQAPPPNMQDILARLGTYRQ